MRAPDPRDDDPARHWLDLSPAERQKALGLADTGLDRIKEAARNWLPPVQERKERPSSPEPYSSAVCGALVGLALAWAFSDGEIVTRAALESYASKFGLRVPSNLDTLRLT